MRYPDDIRHFIANEERSSLAGGAFEKKDPATGKMLARVARGRAEDARLCIDAAEGAFEAWSATPVVARGEILRAATLRMLERKQEAAEIVAAETGKSRKDALGEVGAAIEMGFFIAGEGRRFYGRTTTSAVAQSQRHDRSASRSVRRR